MVDKDDKAVREMELMMTTIMKEHHREEAMVQA